MKKIFDFNRTKTVIKDRELLLSRAAAEGKTLAEIIASDYSEAFEMPEEDGLHLVEDMNACAAEYRREKEKAEALLPEEYLQEKIDAIKTDESFSLYQKYCALSGIYETLSCVNRAQAEKESIEAALDEAKQNVVLKPEEAVTEADLEDLTERLLSSGSICLLMLPEEFRSLVTDALEGEHSSPIEFNKEELALLDAYCIYKAIKSGQLTPDPEWKDADSLVLLRALVFRATAEQDVESIIKEVADGHMTWERAEQIIETISSVLLFGLSVTVLALAAAGSVAAFISIAVSVNLAAALLLFGSMIAALYAMYKGFDYIEGWMREIASPAIARASIKAAKKAKDLAKEAKDRFDDWNNRHKAAPETTGEENKEEESVSAQPEEDPDILTKDPEQTDFA